MTKNYKKTLTACFIGYVVQAIINNFIPLLFLTFQTSYSISLSKITLLVTFNFGVQLFVDLVCAGFVDKIGYRRSMIIAHAFSAVGLCSLTVLPEIMPPFAGIMTSVVIYAIGGGMLEVLVSPIVEACPTDNKEKAMSLLHSFYCWGHVGVVLISTLFFVIFGIENWKMLALIWAAIPLINGFFFTQVPIAPLISDGEKGMTIKEIFRTKVFWILMLAMVCAGASEQAVSQWASTLAERGLNVTKSVGDLAGPMLFAVFMGLSRLLYGKLGDKIRLERFMVLSGILCIIAYLMISLSPSPILSFIGCGLCGFSVGIMWPGTFSISASLLSRGGTALFAFLALSGDIGCSAGPTVVGFISSLFSENLKTGILFAIMFPFLLILCVLLILAHKRRNEG